MNLDIEQGSAGLWYVTSPDVKGLLIADKTPEGALSQVPQAVREIQEAQGDGGTVF